MPTTEIATSGSVPRAPHPVERVARLGPIAFACSFVVASGLYFVTSHSFVRAVASDRALVDELESIQDLFYVVVMGALFYSLLTLLLRSLTRATLEGERRLEALIQAERRSAAALVGSTIGHDLNNLLQVIELATPQGPDDVDATRTENVEMVREAISRARGLVMRLPDFAKVEEQGVVTAVDLRAEVRSTLVVVADHPALRGCQIRVAAPAAPIELPVQKQSLEQALLNLLVNAGDALKNHGVIEVRIRDADGDVVNEVHDSGPGIAPDLRARIFSPLFTTKTEGTGLGLVVVQAYAKAHGGRAEVDKSDLGGACFRRVLPSSPAVAEA
jgi:signal transduction histidine kinase